MLYSLASLLAVASPGTIAADETTTEGGLRVGHGIPNVKMPGFPLVPSHHRKLQSDGSFNAIIGLYCNGNRDELASLFDRENDGDDGLDLGQCTTTAQLVDCICDANFDDSDWAGFGSPGSAGFVTAYTKMCDTGTCRKHVVRDFWAQSIRQQSAVVAEVSAGEITECLCANPQGLSNVFSSQNGSGISDLTSTSECRPLIDAFLGAANAENPEAAPSSPLPCPVDDDDDPCFPSSAMVTMADGTTKAVALLNEGDAIVTATSEGDLATDTVSLLSLSKPNADATFVTLTTPSSTLTLTPNHHLPVGPNCCSNLKKANDVEIGDHIWTVAPGDKPAKASAVTAKSSTTAKGLHSPVMTHGGFPIVDGVVTSFDDTATVSLAATTLKYLLPLCKATGSCGLFRRTFLHADRQYIDEV